MAEPKYQSGYYYHDCEPPPLSLLEQDPRVFIWSPDRTLSTKYERNPECTGDSCSPRRRNSWKRDPDCIEDSPTSSCPEDSSKGCTAGADRRCSYEVVEELGWMSYHDDVAEMNRSFMKVYNGKSPYLGYDLSRGFTDYERRKASIKNSPEKTIILIAKCFLHFHPTKSLTDYSVVSSRGSIRRLLSIPYAKEARDYCELSVYRVGRTLFLDTRLVDKIGPDFDQTIFYRGFHFEHHCINPSRHYSPVPHDEGFMSVVEVRAGPYRLLIGADVDAYNSNTDKYMEMKLCLDAPQHVIVRDRFPQVWVQCFAVGVEELLVGYRDREGCLRRVEAHSVENVERQISWDRETCSSFLTDLIGWLMQNVKHGDPPALLVFSPSGHFRQTAARKCQLRLWKDPDNTVAFPITELRNILQRETPTESEQAPPTQSLRPLLEKTRVAATDLEAKVATDAVAAGGGSTRRRPDGIFGLRDMGRREGEEGEWKRRSDAECSRKEMDMQMNWRLGR